MFLQLLVAQLQNQDPTSPVDPSQFVGQLAQFSELSEVTSIYSLLQQYVPASGSTGSSGGTAPANGKRGQRRPAMRQFRRPPICCGRAWRRFSCGSFRHFPSVAQLRIAGNLGTHQQDPRSVLNA
jgi:hypothetical protein